MKNETLRELNKCGFPWVAFNEKDSKDYKTFLCLSSAIREIEHLKGIGKEYKIVPTEDEMKLFK
jgi:hypothetical protein